jgi:hypothetical protein
MSLQCWVCCGECGCQWLCSDNVAWKASRKDGSHFGSSAEPWRPDSKILAGMNLPVLTNVSLALSLRYDIASEVKIAVLFSFGSSNPSTVQQIQQLSCLQRYSVFANLAWMVTSTYWRLYDTWEVGYVCKARSKMATFCGTLCNFRLARYLVKELHSLLGISSQYLTQPTDNHKSWSNQT